MPGAKKPSSVGLNAEEYMAGISKYCQEKNVYQTFDFLVKELITHQPANPIEYCIRLLDSEVFPLVVMKNL